MKQSEIQGYSITELNDKLAESKLAYVNLERAHVVSPVENTSQIKSLRRTIARIKTAINNQN